MRAAAAVIAGRADPTSSRVDDLRPYAEGALDAFGPSRMMCGSAWPLFLLAGSYDRVTCAARELTAALSPAEQEAVLRGSATLAYQLEGRRA